MKELHAADNMNRPLAPGNIVVYNELNRNLGCMVWLGVYIVTGITYYNSPENRWGVSLASYENRGKTVELEGTYDSVYGWELDNGCIIKIAEGAGAL